MLYNIYLTVHFSVTRTTGSPVGRGGKPVYARIITQTPGMRITQVRPTMQTTQVTSLIKTQETLRKLHTISNR